MLMSMYVIRDLLAMESSAPMLCKNDSVAVVAYRNALARLEFDAAPNYALLHVGSMDTENTVITVLPQVRVVEVPESLFKPVSTTNPEVLNDERAL